MFGARPAAAAATSVHFVAPLALEGGLRERLAVRRNLVGITDTRSLSKADLPENSATPEISVDPETFAVRIDGGLVEEHPAELLPLAQRYFLF